MNAVPPTPDDLLSGAARAKFAELAAHVAASRPLTAFDVDQVRIYADAAAVRAKAVADLRSAPLVIRGSNGNEYPNPLLKVVSQAEDAIDRALRRLKLKPAEVDDAIARDFDAF